LTDWSEWFCGIEVKLRRLIERYVAGGYGIGLAVAVQASSGPGGACFRVPDFPPVVVGASWSGKLPNISSIAANWKPKPSADAPNERQRQGIVEVISSVADLITSRASATLQKRRQVRHGESVLLADRRTPKPENFRGEKAVLILLIRG